MKSKRKCFLPGTLITLLAIALVGTVVVTAWKRMIAVDQSSIEATVGDSSISLADTNGDAKHLILPNDVFQAGSYIYFEDVEILYDGESFSVRNDRSDIIRITAQVVGVKADGTHETIEVPSFSGVDKTQYEKDLAENGWAIEHPTNMVRPGETLTAAMSIYDFSTLGDEYPKADIDGDGYYDITFTIHPQTSESEINVATSDSESEVYRMKAK